MMKLKIKTNYHTLRTVPKYYTLRTVPKYYTLRTVPKYYTLRTVPKTNQKGVMKIVLNSIPATHIPDL